MSGSISATTLAYVGAASAVAGAATTAVGQFQAADAASSSAKYNAQIAANNATIATQNASYAARAGTAQAEQAQLQSRAKVGSIVANQAASGINVNSGSALDVQSSADKLGELNAITVKSNAARQAYGYQTQSTSFSSQSQLDQHQSGADITAGDIGATGTVLGGIGSAGSNYAKFVNAGGGGNNISGNDGGF